MAARLAAALAGRRVARSRPALEAAHLPVVRGRLEVLRDRRGLPHVYAEHEADLWAAVGWLQAADRFVQLDLVRHLGAGRLCELLGNLRAPPGEDELFSGRRVVDLDAFVRPLDFEAASHRDLAAMPAAARACVEAFAEGANAALRAMDGVYPAEYLALGRVRPWHAADCLVAARASGLAIALIPLDNELTFDAVRGAVGDDLASRLYPDAPWAHAPRLERRGAGTSPEPPVHLPAAGSNNWAVSAARSASGAPVLANDPHVPLLPLPTYWYPVHLECPAYRVQGGCFPGFPALGFGHNGALAWGVTTGFRDGFDLYRIHRVPGDPSRYRTPGGTGVLRQHRERRPTRLGRAVELAWESCEHGVVYPGWKHHDGVDLALRQVPADAGRFLAGALALLAATSVEAHRAALAELNAGPFDFNHVWAHRDGAIGWELYGRLPRRRRDGLFVRDAHDPEAQWEGFLDFEEMPRLLDPPAGFVASANSLVDPAQAARIATRVHFEPRHRQDRIEDRLAAAPAHRPEDSMALQADVEAAYAPALRDALVARLARFEGADAPAGPALAALAAWPGDFGTTSTGAAIFFFTQRALSELVYGALLGARLGRRFAHGRRAVPRLQRVLLDADDPLRADVERAAGRTLDDLAAEAFRAALARLERSCGPASEWRWGRIQRARLGTLLAEIPGLGARLRALDAPFPGDDYTVSPSRALDEGRRLRAFVAASSRFVCDLARPDEAWFAHSSGPSGDPGSAWHANLCEEWSRFAYFRSALVPADQVPDVVERLVVRPRK